VSADMLILSFAWDDEPPLAFEPVSLILGMPRPQTARKVLREATALGVASIHFVPTEKGEAGYTRSVLWSSGEWRRHLIAGAEQAFSTHLPEVSIGRSLTDVVDPLGAGCRIALDNYEACRRLSDVAVEAPVILALGPERGWSASERALLVTAGFEFAHLGPRVLRVETAAVAALAVVRGKLGLL
jgi:16S rRNA (uracil1498-N3)-methyltransferase